MMTSTTRPTENTGGFTVFVSHKQTAGFMHSVPVAMAQHLSKCSSIVAITDFMPVGIFAAQRRLFQEVPLVLPNSSCLTDDLRVVHLRTMTGRVITCSVASLASATQARIYGTVPVLSGVTIVV